ncbi:segregation/condensation protein A [Candidatus Pacearchaeota archaeon]|nr:segregation/condensation protein A [Candidatus Pacearchaeota archaeon]
MEKEEEDALSSLFGDMLIDSSAGNPVKMHPKQEQIHDLLFSREIGWQEIIYDLINTEQLDPWDIDISILANRYLEKIQKFEEENYFVSSKVLLAAALLLRIKSEILLNRYIKSIDEILFGKKEDKYKPMERIYLEDEIPELIPKSPIPRFRKVTLRELVESLNKAIITENRRIKKEVLKGNALREAEISLPKRNYLIHEKIKELYDKIVQRIKDQINIKFAEISGETKEEKIVSFMSMLHLDNQKRIWIEQNEHFGDIFISLKK